MNGSIFSPNPCRCSIWTRLETLPDTTRVYRVNDVTALLKAGIPLSKLDILRDVLGENAYSLSDSSHLRCLIPFILQNEVKKIKEDIYSWGECGNYIS